jgi:hypothetical protein
MRDPLSAHPGADEIRQRFGSSFRRILFTSENRLLALLASGLADDKVEHARDGAIKFVAGRAGAIAFN